MFIIVILRPHAWSMTIKLTFQPFYNHGAILSSGDLTIPPADSMSYVQRTIPFVKTDAC